VPAGPYDRELFIPAESELEAASRIFALTGREPEQTRGPKRALVDLARSLRLEIDVTVTNGVLGRHIADKLGVEWGESAATRTNQITLDGMNALLEGAANAYREGSLTRVLERPETLIGWSDFRPARSKIEAVNRISALTQSGPEVLGPGSKERKSVLENLARARFLEIDTRLSKTDLGAALANALGVPWTDDCYSTGYTISLIGLNTILAGAERHLGLLGAAASATFKTPEEEGAALVATLVERLPSHWDGRKCVKEMRDAGYSQWRQMEWPGFYNEFVGIPALNDTFAMSETGGPLRRFGQTDFDYANGWVWDLKAHTERQRNIPSGSVSSGDETIILNDAEAARACINQQGLGFLIVGGESHFDDGGVFDDWHRQFTRDGTTSTTRSNTGTSRRRKVAFTPTRCEAFWIANLQALNAATLAGQVTIRPQGRQQARAGETEGAARRDKLHMNARKARGLLVGTQWSRRS
jgi:hypothetical protein